MHPSPPILHQPYIPTPYPEMVKIEGGSFMMGSRERDREQPVHEVQVADFKLAKYPVTNAQFALFLNEYGSDRVQEGDIKGAEICTEYQWGVQKKENVWLAAQGYESYPMIRVTWYGAIIYCDWLSKKLGVALRLPSEAEWEYAAGGGSKTMNYLFAGGNKLKKVAWYNQNSMEMTRPVGMKLPNKLGLYDMSGNVWEWCADHWHETYKGAPNDSQAWTEGGDADLRVFRGGSWFYSGNDCRVSARPLGGLPNDGNDSQGFRVAGY